MALVYQMGLFFANLACRTKRPSIAAVRNLPVRLVVVKIDIARSRRLYFQGKEFVVNLHLCAPLIAGWFALVSVAMAAERPLNVLIVQTDEHHYSTLGCYGGKIVDTTHIDWLAKNGALCTSFYATTPVCSPSRAALVSGLYPQKTPVVTNNIPLNGSVVTFAEVLRRRGYATGFAGKWHLDGNGKPQWAPERQFGFADNRFMFNRGHWKKFEVTPQGPRVAARSQQGQPTYGVDGADSKSFATDFLVDKAIDFIQEHRDQPFCYYVSLPDPHGPNTVRAPYDTMYAGVRVPIPSTIKKPADQIPQWAIPAKGVNANTIKKIMPHYYGMVKCIDDNIGRLIGTLREQNLLGNTVIVFTSDHGDLCGEHGRLNKGVPYEGSARIPFIVYHPGKVRPGTVVNQALSCVDFFPTLMALLEQPTDLALDGRDASALLQGQMPKDWNDVAFLRGTETWLCAVTDRYKLIYAEHETPWLLDLEMDPEERMNHYAKPAYQQIVTRLTRELANYMKTHDDPRSSSAKIVREMAKHLPE